MKVLARGDFVIHKTSRLCDNFVAPKPRKKKVTHITPSQAAETDADELEAIDAMPLQEDGESNSSGSSGFFDAEEGYCSSSDGEDDDAATTLTATDVLGSNSTEI